MKTLQLIFFLIIFFFAIFVIVLLNNNKQFIFKNKAVGSNQTTAFRPVIFKTWDYRNEDFAKVCPECGPMGGINIMGWRQLNPSQGSYNWDALDNYLRNAAAMQTAPFPDGTTIPKPIIIEFDFWAEAAPANSKYNGDDYTPNWVYNGPVTPECVNLDNGQPDINCTSSNKRKTGHVYPLCGQDSGKYAIMPAIDNSAWQNAYFDFIRAVGEKYNNDPKVSGVVASMGMGAEAFLSKGSLDCSPPYRNTFQNNYKTKFIPNLVQVYRDSFPNKAVFLTLGGSNYTQDVADQAFKDPARLLGLKSNGLDSDLNWYLYYNHDRDLQMTWPFANFDGENFDGTDFTGRVRPFTMWGFEDAKLPGPRDIYVMTLWVLSGHASFIDWRNIDHMRGVIQILPNFWTQFVPRYLGKELDEVTSVWTVLRETSFNPDKCYEPSQVVPKTEACYYGKRGNFNYWLKQLDNVSGGRTVALTPDKNDPGKRLRMLSTSAQNEIFAYSLRRTNEATGNKYMYFKIDDDFSMKKDKQTVFETIIILLNNGSDTFSIDYKTTAGETKSIKVQKGAGLGEVGKFVIVPLVLDQADFTGGMDGGADFRLSSEGDGDEIVHMVIIGEDLPEIKYTAQPVNPTIPPRPTKLPQTPSPVPPTPTRNPLTPSPIPPTASPTPYPTGTIKLDLKLSLQGILSPPADLYNKINIKVLTLTSLFKEPKEKVGEFICNDQGIWEGKVTFDNMPLGPKYDILISIPKHLNEEFDSLTLTEGKNNLDFSDTVILAGDINADEIINSYDLSYIRNNLNSSEDAILTKADLNLDGIVNANDFSLAISGLKEQE